MSGLKSYRLRSGQIVEFWGETDLYGLHGDPRRPPWRDVGSADRAGVVRWRALPGEHSHARRTSATSAATAPSVLRFQVASDTRAKTAPNTSEFASHITGNTSMRAKELAPALIPTSQAAYAWLIRTTSPNAAGPPTSTPTPHPVERRSPCEG